MPAGRILGLALGVGLVLASAAATAEDAQYRALDTTIPDHAATAPPSSGDGTKPADGNDLASRIDQLEANRAATSQKSPISLSVSGWVSQQVTITKQ